MKNTPVNTKLQLWFVVWFFFVHFLFFSSFFSFFSFFFSHCKHLKDGPLPLSRGEQWPRRVPISTLQGPGWRSPKGRWERGEISHLVSAKKPSRAPGRVRVGGGGVAGEKCHVLRLAGCPPAAFPFRFGEKSQTSWQGFGRGRPRGLPGRQSSPGDQRLWRGEQVAPLFSHCRLLDVSFCFKS